MADQAENYLDYSRGSSTKKGKKKRKNKKNKNFGENSFMHHNAPAEEPADEELGVNKNPVESLACDADAPSSPESGKEWEVPEADQTEDKESETPEAERVEDLSPTESLSFDDETEDKENTEAAVVEDVVGVESEEWVPSLEEDDEVAGENEVEEDQVMQDGNYEDSAEEDEVDIPLEIDEEGRRELYEKAVNFLKQGRRDAALRCFLRCLTGLKENSGFRYLPQCLHQIADIYYEKEELDKAIQFIQAEKMYYETALINTSHKQKLVEDKRRSLGGDMDDKENVRANPEILKADEYENLAKLCLDKNQPQLALEYQGKATKIRQQVYGQNHPVTANSLDNFAVIYAEVGKQLYSESMQKMSEDTAMSEEMLNQIEVEPASELRNRKKNEASKEKEMNAALEKDEISNQESPVTQVDEQDSLEVLPPSESVSGTLLWILFFIFTLVLSVIVFYIYCRWDVSSKSCIAWKSDLHYYYMKAKHLYYNYFFPNTESP